MSFYGRWFSLGTPVSSTNKTDCHDKTEILFKVTLNNINEKQTIPHWKLKRVHDRIISLRGKVWAHTTRFTPPFFIEVPVSNQEDERSYICELVISIVPLSTISYPTVWYCLFFVYGV
jgi:hypothetical protein